MICLHVLIRSSAVNLNHLMTNHYFQICLVHWWRSLFYWLHVCSIWVLTETWLTPTNVDMHNDIGKRQKLEALAPMVCTGSFSRDCRAWKSLTPLLWRNNGRDGVSNHQPHDCLLKHLFRRPSKKTSKLRVTGLCGGNLPESGEFPAQRASNAENVSIWWRHHGITGPWWWPSGSPLGVKTNDKDITDPHKRSIMSLLIALTSYWTQLSCRYFEAPGRSCDVIVIDHEMKFPVEIRLDVWNCNRLLVEQFVTHEQFLLTNKVYLDSTLRHFVQHVPHI